MLKYALVQKVLADLKVLQRGLAATKVSTTVYETPLKMLPGPEDQRTHIQQVERAALANPHSPLRGVTDKSNMDYSIYENRLVLKHSHKYLCCRQAPPEYFWISENFLDGSVESCSPNMHSRHP